MYHPNAKAIKTESCGISGDDFITPFHTYTFTVRRKLKGRQGRGKTGKTFFTRVSSKLSFTIVLHYDPIRAEQNKIWLRCETFAQIFPILSRPRNNIRLFRSSVSRPYLLPLEYKTLFTTYTNVLLFFIYKTKKIPCFFIEFFYYFNTRLIKLILILCNIFITQGKRFKNKNPVQITNLTIHRLTRKKSQSLKHTKPNSQTHFN